MTQTNNIEVADIGPVVEFRMDMDRPGLWVLRGRQGAGKTTILRTVGMATDGRTDIKPTKRDGAKRGTATVAGKTLTVAKRVTEDGELGVEGLGDLNIATLHAPKFIDAGTRDKHRIATLVRLAGLKADASLFHDLLGGRERFESIVDAGSIATDDLVEMAAQVKRRIETEAQRTEAKLETAKATMRAQAAIAEGIDLNAPHDGAKLQAALSQSIETRSRLMQKRESALEVIERAKAAQAALDEHASTSISVHDAEEEREQAADIRDAAAETVRELEARLAAAKAKLEAAAVNLGRAEDRLAAARRDAELTAAWRADIEAAHKIECPSEETVASACSAADRANEAVSMGVRVRQAIESTRRSEAAGAEAKALTDAAKRLRAAAAATTDVLSDAIAAIPECPLRVTVDGDGNSRLVIQTDRSEDEPFDELSDGERWLVILRFAAGANKLIVLPQAAFGELSESSRVELHRIATETGCYLLTAVAEDTDLAGEIYA